VGREGSRQVRGVAAYACVDLIIFYRTYFRSGRRVEEEDRQAERRSAEEGSAEGG